MELLLQPFQHSLGRRGPALDFVNQAQRAGSDAVAYSLSFFVGKEATVGLLFVAGPGGLQQQRRLPVGCALAFGPGGELLQGLGGAGGGEEVAEVGCLIHFVFILESLANSRS